MDAQERHDGHRETSTAAGWRMVPMPEGMFMLPGTEMLVPSVQPFLPGMGIDPATVPEAVFRKVVHVASGDTLDLEATVVRRRVKDFEFVGYGFNGQYPGPLIRVEQDASITVRFTNKIDWPSTVHWHGLRLENRFDGVPHLTQDPVMPGETFFYEVTFPDAGIYWYHPHHREDVTQGLGLVGNILVDSSLDEYYGPAHRDEVLLLDDLLFDDAGLFPFGMEAATHALMGRFGNVLLVNGEPEHRMEFHRGEVVRFHLTNASSTRTYNLSFSDGTPFKLVASDLSRFEREEWTPNLVLAPAERYVVEVQFSVPGEVALVNDVLGIDHMHGQFMREVDTLSTVSISPRAMEPDLAESHGRLRANEEVTRGIDPLRSLFDGPVDHSLTVSVRARGLPLPIVNLVELDTMYFAPVEWTDAMPDMNWLSTTDNIQWILRDDATGRENMDIDWRFDQGDLVKIRIFNDPRSFHPMQHPIHLHGQRFLVLEQDGVPRTNLVWKDTALVPTGSTIHLLVEMSNPGKWMLHCHISEHLGSGMMMAFTVNETPAEPTR